MIFRVCFFQNKSHSCSSSSLILMKYILVTGGVISGIGKGIISSSIGTILHSYGFRVTSIKVKTNNLIN